MCTIKLFLTGTYAVICLLISQTVAAAATPFPPPSNTLRSKAERFAAKNFDLSKCPNIFRVSSN